MDLVGQAGEVVVVLGQRRQLGPHLPQQLAVVEGLGAREQFSAFSAIRSPSRRSRRPRVVWERSRQAGSSKARWAALTARSMSAAVPRAAS